MVNIMTETQHSNLCIVCRENKLAGIRIWGQFVCTDCERDIVHTEVEDEKYPFYIERMKRIWLDMIS